VASRPVDDEVLAAALAAVREHGNRSAAARALDIPRSTLDHRCNLAISRGLEAAPAQEVELPSFAEPGDIPVEDILNTMERRFERRAAAHTEKQWYEIKFKKSTLPIALHFIGDPHIDSGACNISALRSDLSLMRNPGPGGEDTGHYACNLGDTTDGDWPGRLMRLHAKSDTSLDTARRLARWMLNEAGVKYLAWIMGNHDLWGADADLLKAANTHRIPMADWCAKWQLVFPNGQRVRIISAHDFPGRSIWNSLHSNQRAAITTSKAHIFASGHTHHWAMHQEEHEHRNFVYWLIRARGYKWSALDDYAERLGHPGQQHGSTISAIIDPQATSEVRLTTCFADVAEAADYLAWKRSR